MAEDRDYDQFRDLTTRLRGGDLTALDELWRRFGDDLRRRARTRLRRYGISGQAESMDICNAVLLDLVRQGTVDLRSPADLMRYVCSAIDNEVRDLLKSLLRERRDIRRMTDQSVEGLEGAGGGTSPAFALIRDEALEQLRSELGEDGPQLVELVLARHSWGEIGERLRMKPDAARMRWLRAVRRVQERLGVSGDESPGEALS